MAKKYFTLSFDDGVEQDKHIIEILKRYQLSARSTNILKYPLWLDKSKCLMKGGFFMLGVSDIFLIR